MADCAALRRGRGRAAPRVEEEHQQINDLVADIERLDPGGPERERKTQRVFALRRQDIRDEENLLLPWQQDTMDTAHLSRLGVAWETVRRNAPTHPPPRPTATAEQRDAGVPLSIHDRIRDTFGLGGSGTASQRLLTGLAVLLISADAAVVIGRRRH